MAVMVTAMLRMQPQLRSAMALQRLSSRAVGNSLAPASLVRWMGDGVKRENATATRSFSTGGKAVVMLPNAAHDWNHRSFVSVGTAAATLGCVATAAVVAGTSTTDDTHLEPTPERNEERLEYAQVVEVLREQISEFRSTLKSQDSRLPKSFPVQKITISRVHAPNGVATIRIEFVCPPFVDHDAILGRFLLNLQKAGVNKDGQEHSKQVIEVVPGTGNREDDEKSIVDFSYDQPSVNFLYLNGHGSFQFVRDPNSSMQPSMGASFVFYKDEFLTSREINAVVEAYKELYSYPNVHAFFQQERDRVQRKMRIGRGQPNAMHTAPASSSKEDAVQQLQSLGIVVFEPVDGEDHLNWDSLAGYDDVKLEIEDTVVLALQNPDLYDEIARKTRCRYESNRPRAVLFEGPPGTGKTLSARIIAQQAGIPMIHIPIESVVSKWYGDSEKKMSAIFDACEKFDGAIIFIDEIDALAGNRSGGTMHEASRRILSVLLQKVEGFASAKKTTVVCATNRKQDLDAALISRFDLCIRYELPTEKTRQAVFARYAKQLSTEELGQLASISHDMSCRDIKERAELTKDMHWLAQICEYAERKWASRVLKKEVTSQLPPLHAYMDATKVHSLGIRTRDPSRDVYEA